MNPIRDFKEFSTVSIWLSSYPQIGFIGVPFNSGSLCSSTPTKIMDRFLFIRLFEKAHTVFKMLSLWRWDFLYLMQSDSSLHSLRYCKAIFLISSEFIFSPHFLDFRITYAFQCTNFTMKVHFFQGSYTHLISLISLAFFGHFYDLATPPSQHA